MATYDKLVRDIEKINAKLQACEVALTILRNAQRDNANNPYVVEILQQLENIIINNMRMYEISRKTKLDKLKEIIKE